jgi:outer membrane protein assembly factor BamB
MRARKLAVFAVSLVALPLSALANDWPQWRGPDRTDVSKETGLLKSWPEKGPHLLWTYKEAGVGYSGPAIVGDRLYTMGADEKADTVYALDARTGKRLWTTDIAPRIKLNRGDGPRGTPTVDGDRLYALGSQGELVCLDLATGKKRWAVNLVKDLGGGRPNWGFSESPLVDGDKVICTPGGSKGTLAALDKKTGKVSWRSDVGYPAHYSSAIVAAVGGVRQYIQLTTNGVFGVSAANGKLLWESKLGGCGTAAIPTPIFHDGYVFVTSGYTDSKDGQIKLTATNGKVTATEVYSGRTLVNKHGGVVLLDGVLYGNSEAVGPWVAMEFLTGKKLGWSGRNLPPGSITYADGRLYLYDEQDGTVVLLEPDPKEWKETGRFTIPEKTKERPASSKIWTHPVVANGRLYLRDHEFIFCYDIRATN